VDSRLRECNNVILTPHVAAYSAAAWSALRSEMCSTTISFVRDGWADAIVNPEVRGNLRPA
jgi:phosphoglycerate dehydrogenase-like enzyme